MFLSSRVCFRVFLLSYENKYVIGGGDGNRTRVLEASQYILYMFRTLILSPEWLQRTQPSLASSLFVST